MTLVVRALSVLLLLFGYVCFFTERESW